MALLLTDPRTAQLAQELAMRIEPASAIVKRYGLSGQEIRDLLAHPGFQQLMEAAAAQWESAQRIDERIAAKAKYAVEANLPHMHEIIVDPNVQAAARVQAFNQLRSLSGVGQKDQNPNGAGSEKFTLNIILGDGKEPALSISGPAKVIEGEASEGERQG